ncbi:uncharacterized protein [Penaeus vannamei]|uniref:uncharacterized protein n=1 Tax=Penaeus vannamei TaxID=6689 RepID=UPI00387F71C9
MARLCFPYQGCATLDIMHVHYGILVLCCNHGTDLAAGAGRPNPCPGKQRILHRRGRGEGRRISGAACGGGSAGGLREHERRDGRSLGISEGLITGTVRVRETPRMRSEEFGQYSRSVRAICEQVSCRGTFVVNIPTLCSKLAGGASPIAAVHTSAINMKLHFVVCLAFITLIHFRVPGCCADFKDIERGGAFYAGGRDADQPLVGAITGGDGNRPRPPIRVGPSRRCLQYDYRGRCVYWSGIG